MYWDRQRNVHYPTLAIQFGVCVGCWLLVVTVLGAKVSGPGLTASIATGCVLVVVSWLLAKFGIPPPQPRVRAPHARTVDEPAPSESPLSD